MRLKRAAAYGRLAPIGPRGGKWRFPDPFLTFANGRLAASKLTVKDGLRADYHPMALLYRAAQAPSFPRS